MTSLGDELADQRERSVARMGAKSAAVIRTAIEELRASGAAESALGSGARAPLFSLPSARGDTIRLGDLLGRRAVVLVFYRGSW